MKINITLVVLQEHTLGYIDERTPHIMSVLVGSVLKGSPYSIYNSIAYIKDLPYRLATEKDFEVYNCYFDGYKNDKFFNYIYKK